jgi:RNA polymerase sigma factor (sigma-70 family)
MVAEALGEQSDRQLVEQFIARHDEAVFEVLVRRHGPMVYRVCWRVLQHSQDVEDAFQATFLLLARKLPTVRNRDSLASWLHGVAHRVALKARAQAARRRRHEQEAPVSRSSLPDDVTWGELRTVLDAELAQLPEKWRLPLVLCYLEGRTQEEASRQLGWSKSTLLRRLDEAREALGRRLRRHGIVASAALAAVLLSDCVAPAALSPGLVGSTVDNSAPVAAGQVAQVAVSPRIVALTEGVLKTMSLSKLTLTAAVVVACALFCGEVLLAPATRAVGQPEARKPETPQPGTREPERRKPSRFLQDDHWITSVAWSPDGKTLAGVTYDPRSLGINATEKGSAVKLWDVATGSVKCTLAEDFLRDHFWHLVAFSPDGKLVAASSDGCGEKDRTHGGCVVVWDAETGKVTQTLKHLTLVRCLAFSPDGKTLAMASGGALKELVKLWDVRSGELQKTLTSTDDGQQVWTLAFSPDGKTLAARVSATDTPSEIVLWDPKKDEQQSLPKSDVLGTGCHPSIAFSPDGTVLAAVGPDLRLWDVGKRELKHAVEIGSGKWEHVTISPDGKTLALAGRQEKKAVIALVDVATLKVTALLEGHEGYISGLAFSRDGKTLASGSEDRTIKLWDFDQRKKKDEK